MVTRAQLWPVIVTVGSAAAVAIAAHTWVNLRVLRSPGVRPTRDPHPGEEPPGDPGEQERVSILIPARNEAATIEAAVSSALSQRGVQHLDVTVLDDGSTDATAAITATLADDERLQVHTGADEPPPPGWLGKPWACHRLADQASGSILVFMDADVILAPAAVAALVDELRSHDLAMIAPYPEQIAEGWLERLVQPLVTWSWVATMPLAWAERSLRPSLSAANGQLIAVDADAYRTSGGHGAVRDSVLEDIELMRAFKRSGYRTATADGSSLASCRMYASTEEVVNGYTKSLWAAFGGPVGSLAAVGVMNLAFVIPAVAVALPGRRSRVIGLVGYAAGVTSRSLVARRIGAPAVPDALAHPLSIVSFTLLTALSWKRHLRGENRWKGRPVVTAS